MSEKLLGDFCYALPTFDHLDRAFDALLTSHFKSSNEEEKYKLVSALLFKLIKATPAPTFLLRAFVEFASFVVKKEILPRYSIHDFETWLNQFSHCSFEEQLEVRSKIMGRKVPREIYQKLFPIGMGKVFFGSHFVTAHQSPDLDTTVASFWGFVDAFSAKVGDRLHIWNLPGGPPSSVLEIDMLFYDLFGQEVFSILAKDRLALTVNTLDLMTQEGLKYKRPHDVALSFDHERHTNAVILVNEEGYYLGDWRSVDVEGVRQVISLLQSTLHWLERLLFADLVALFAQKQISRADVESFVEKVVGLAFVDSKALDECTLRQKSALEKFFKVVLKMPKGLQTTLGEFAEQLAAQKMEKFASFVELLHQFPQKLHFETTGEDVRGKLPDVQAIFSSIHVLFSRLTDGVHTLLTRLETLDVALQVKSDIFGLQPKYLMHHDEIEEIRSKMESYSHLTVNRSNQEGDLIPVGILPAALLQKETLGTVTLRDFCNRKEMGIPPYLEVISVIDHHASTLSTLSPPMAMVCDTQSANCLVAELCFSINDRYSTGGLNQEAIDTQLKSAASLSVQRRLLQRKINAQKKDVYVHPLREFVEYLHYVYAILDDTDLLSKVSRRDIVCVANLLNRLKSISLGKEVEVVTFEDLEGEEEGSLVKNGSARLLQNKDFYSLYDKVYKAKEAYLDKELERCSEESTLFLDTKTLYEQSRVGQTKLFPKNISTFLTIAPKMRKQWYEQVSAHHKTHAEADLYMHMISTIKSAEEVFKGEEGQYKHQDELWIWTPSLEGSLRGFLSRFKVCLPLTHAKHLSVELLGKNHKALAKMVKDNFLKCSLTVKEEALPIIVMRFDAGILNSRKSMIAPYLPRKKEF